jgi:hypothetical protein
LLRGVVQLLHLSEKLGSQRIAQKRLRFLQLSREAAVESARLLELPLQRRGGVLQLLHVLGERALILGYRFCLLSGVVAHRILLVA